MSTFPHLFNVQCKENTKQSNAVDCGVHTALAAEVFINTALLNETLTVDVFRKASLWHSEADVNVLRIGAVAGLMSEWVSAFQNVRQEGIRSCMKDYTAVFQDLYANKVSEIQYGPSMTEII